MGLSSRDVIKYLLGGFNPLSWFSSGAQGAWYNPSDLTTLFQDSAGTNPVTAVEQPVGLMLDKSKGLVLGNELAPSLLSAAGWSTSSGKWVVSGGFASIDGTQVSTTYLQPNPTIYTPGKTIKITYTIASISGGSGFRVELSTASGQPYVEPILRTAPGTYTCYLSSTAGGSIYFGATSGCAVTLSNISVKELSGNHAFQATAGNRPTLSARVNILSATETLSTQTITTQATTYNLYFTGSGTVTLSGTATGTYSAGTNTITCTAGSLTLTVSGSVLTADLRPANIGTNLPSYQRVSASTDYDTAGFPLYLKANGASSAMATNSIDFTSTANMTVVAGVRKLSDAAQGIVSELSATSTTNNGSFALSAPGGAAANFTYLSKGTTADTVTATAYTSPISAIIAASSSISAPSNAIRVNGSSVSSNTNSEGTGNFGNYPLYLFARGGASLWFNGQFYGAIICGAAQSASQITLAENYMNNKLGGIY